MSEAPGDKQGWFPIIAIICALLLLVGVGAVVAVRKAIPEANRALSAVNLQMIGTGMKAYAAAYGRHYPEHAGQLLGSWAPQKLFLDPRNAGGVPPTYGGEPRPAAVYRFGDVIFLYDPTQEMGKLPHQILAVSVTDYDPQWRNIIIEDGSVMRVQVSSFPSILASDNAARKAAGVPEIDIKNIEALDNPQTVAP